MRICYHPKNETHECKYVNCPFSHRYSHPNENLSYHDIPNWRELPKYCMWRVPNPEAGIIRG